MYERRITKSFVPLIIRDGGRSVVFSGRGFTSVLYVVTEVLFGVCTSIGSICVSNSKQFLEIDNFFLLILFLVVFG